MKKLLFLGVAATLIGSSAQASEWFLFSTSSKSDHGDKNRTAVYFDLDSQRVRENIASVWVVYVFENRISNREYKSFKSLESFNCSAEQSRVVSIISTDWNGNTLSNNTPDLSWTNIAPDTVADKLSAVVCKQDYTDTHGPVIEPEKSTAKIFSHWGAAPKRR